MKSLLDLGSATTEVTEFAGTDLLAVRDLVSRGEIVLVSNEVPRLSDRIDAWPWDVAESIGDCAVVPVSCLSGGTFQRYPLVAGPKESIRFLCSYAEQLPPARFPYETLPFHVDYREFRDLWVVPDTRMAPHDFAFHLGKLMAWLHSRNVLHGDAHRDNFLVDERGHPVMGDVDDMVFLYCEPSTAQCATDILPLLHALDPNEWLNFRLGYRQEWPGSFRVIDLIQLSDLTGWATAFRGMDFRRAVELISQQLDGGCLPVVSVMLLLNRAMALSRIGRHDDAWQDCLKGATLAKEHCPHVASGLAYVLAVVYMGEGNGPMRWIRFRRSRTSLSACCAASSSLSFSYRS